MNLIIKRYLAFLDKRTNDLDYLLNQFRLFSVRHVLAYLTPYIRNIMPAAVKLNSNLKSYKMAAKEPQNAIEKKLMAQENFEVATKLGRYWHEDKTTCDICKIKITGRHMIDGKLHGVAEFALMCPKCHQAKGSGFGDGKGQLYTKIEQGKWLMTYGFPKDEEDDDF